MFWIVIPLCISQDTVGPMARSVKDAAITLSVIAGKDRKDNASLPQPYPIPDYLNALNPNALKGKRIGVPRKIFLDESLRPHFPSSARITFERALKVMELMGATIVDPADLPSAEEITVSLDEWLVCRMEFKVRLSSIPSFPR
jgi:amidase